MRKRIVGLFFCILPLLGLTPSMGPAQSDVITGVRVSIKAGSASELVKFFNSRVVLNMDGVKNTYSTAQAEFVLKDFFEKNPPEENGFHYVHQGSSKDSLKYAIGKYFSRNGNSYQVVLLIKPVEGSYVVDSLDFIKE